MLDFASLLSLPNVWKYTPHFAIFVLSLHSSFTLKLWAYLTFVNAAVLTLATVATCKKKLALLIANDFNGFASHAAFVFALKHTSWDKNPVASADATLSNCVFVATLGTTTTVFTLCSVCGAAVSEPLTWAWAPNNYTLFASVVPFSFSNHFVDVPATTVVRSIPTVSTVFPLAGAEYLLIVFNVYPRSTLVAESATPKEITFPAAYAESILTLYVVFAVVAN